MLPNLASHAFYSVLLLVFNLLPGIFAARCLNCYDDPSNGAAHDTDNCPWITVVATNVGALAAASAVTLTVTHVLPTRLIRLFPKAVLGTLKAIASRPGDGGTFALSDTSKLMDVVKAIQSGSLTKEDAELHYATLISDIDATAEGAASTLKKLEVALSTVRNVSCRVAPGSSITGKYLYILARLSTVLCKEENLKFELSLDENTCQECATEGPSSSSSSSGLARTYAASLFRPRSFAQMAALLNHFVLVAHATGVASPVVLLPFLDDVVWEPLRICLFPWPVAFELLLVYLHLVEGDSRWTLSNVFHGSGGIDAKRAEAESMASGKYPADAFRAHGGKPEPRTGPGDDDKKKGGDAVYVGTVEHNPNATRGCAAFNNGTTHLKKHVGAGGLCNFFHGCDQFVTDKGPGGQCLSLLHKRKACTYDASKKCKQPVKA